MKESKKRSPLSLGDCLMCGADALRVRSATVAENAGQRYADGQVATYTRELEVELACIACGGVITCTHEPPPMTATELSERPRLLLEERLLKSEFCRRQP